MHDNDEKQQVSTLAKNNAQSSTNNDIADTGDTSTTQNSDQQDSIDKFKAAGTKARLDAKNIRKAAEDALADIKKKQKNSLDAAIEQIKPAVETSSSGNSKPTPLTQSNHSDLARVSLLNDLLVGKSLLSPLAGLEKIKTSHQLQMNKHLKAVMLNKPVVPEAE